MADRYVIAAGGNWNSTATWSDSSGGAGGFSIPTSSDNVFVDASSGNLVIDTNTGCANFDATGHTGTISGSTGLIVSGGTFTLSAAGTYTYTGFLSYSGANAVGDVTITRAGKTSNQNNIFDGVGKVFKLADALNIGTNALTVTNGTFNSQGFDITCLNFNSSNTNTRTITLTGSDVFLTGAFSVNATNLTFAAPDLLRMTRNSAAISPAVKLIDGGVALKKVEISMQPTASFTGFGIDGTGGALSIEYLEFIGVPSATFLSCVISTSASLTIDRCAFIEGAELVSSVRGTQRTITTGTDQISFDGCMIRDIVISGGPAIATNSIDLGNNSGITFQNVGPYTHEIVGVTYDDAGAILGGVTCTATKEIDGEVVVVSTTTSDAVTGAYTLPTADNDAAAYTVTWTKLGSPRGDAMCGITPTAP